MMLWIQQLCVEQPWRFKQGFDWATSGNKYDDTKAESGGVELYDAKVDAAKWGAVFKGDPSPVARWKQLVGEGELERAHACVRDDIAPHIVATEWYKHVPGDRRRNIRFCNVGPGSTTCRAWSCSEWRVDCVAQCQSQIPPGAGPTHAAP